DPVVLGPDRKGAGSEGGSLVERWNLISGLLKFVFGPSAVHALDLIDQHSVTRITSPSRRTVYQVLGSSGRVYTCFPSCHFCSCPAFVFSVLWRNDALVVSDVLLASNVWV
uniref:Zinc finger SWIM-type containing 7 n=1 Tax=Latimeria chalumnae TaxID=7897 RepID=M3XH52_LATCH